MVVWLLFSLIAILLAYLGDPSNAITKNNKLFQALLSIWLAWFVSFGGGAMQDQANYMSFYNSLAHNDLLGLGEMLKFHLNALTEARSDTEIGYVFMNILFNKIGFSYIGFSFFFSIIANNLLVSFIYRFRYPVLIILVYITTTYFTQQANLVRQMMAISIFLFSTKYILEKNIFKYLVAIFVASLFHVSSLILLPAYFIINRNYPKFILLIIWAFSLVINVLDTQFEFLKNIESWGVYYYSLSLSKDMRVSMDIGIEWKLNVVLFIFLAFKNTNWKKDIIYLMVLNLFFIGVVLQNLRVVSYWLFRVSLYFTVVYVILVPVIVNNLANTKVAKFINFRMVGKYLILLIIMYHSYLLFSYTFRPKATGTTLGVKMYSFSEIFKD
jgi:transmembrane protein EpsG